MSDVKIFYSSLVEYNSSLYNQIMFSTAYSCYCMGYDLIVQNITDL